MGLTRLFYLFNEHHRELVERFVLPTFLEHNSEAFELEGVRLPEPGGSVSFGTRQFQRMTTEKARAVADLSRSQSHPFIVSDCDIQFFGPISQEVEATEELSLDVVFQKESDIHGVNTGFMLIKPSERVSAFWGAVVSELEASENERLNDQHVANRRLGRSDLKHGTFGPAVWAYSQGGLGPHVLLHHANCTSGLEAKIRQLNRVRRMLHLKPI
jgi:hypothetical protein